MSITAMKQAMEALEVANSCVDGYYIPKGKTQLPEVESAITALRQAIENAQKPVAWGVDWGKAGDIPCVSIIKRLPDGGIEVLACEYAPYSYTSPPVATNDTSQERVDKTAKQRHEPVIDKSAAIRIATALGWTPPRQPLLDEQIKQIWLNGKDHGDDWLDVQAIARAIEQAHDIKENT